MNTNYKILLLLLLAPLVLLLVCCSDKGCTNKLAINYNIAANKDDGTCMVCKLTSNIQDTATASIVDENGSSPFFNQEVARVIFTQSTLNYNYSVCDSSTTSSNGNCQLSFKVINLTNRQMTAFFVIQGFNNISFEAEVDNLVIPAGGTSPSQAVTNATNPCGILTANELDVEDTNFSYQ